MAQERLDVDVWALRSVAEQSVKGYLRVDGPIYDLLPVSSNQKLRILVKDWATGDSSARDARHNELLRVLEIHGGSIDRERYRAEDPHVIVHVSCTLVLIKHEVHHIRLLEMLG